MVHYKITETFQHGHHVWRLSERVKEGISVDTIAVIYDEVYARRIVELLNEEPDLNVENMRKISVSAAAILGVSPSRIFDLLVEYADGYVRELEREKSP